MALTEKDMQEIAPGIFKANEKTYYIKCCMSQKLCFCSKERLDKLSKKNGGMEFVSGNYISRDAKRLKKAGTTNTALKKMDPKFLNEEAKMIHEERKKKRTQRREKRERKEQSVLSNQLHVDPSLPPLDPLTIVEKTSKHGCLRTIYRSQWGCCNRCMYEADCKSDNKLHKYSVSDKDAEIVRKMFKKKVA